MGHFAKPIVGATVMALAQPTLFQLAIVILGGPGLIYQNNAFNRVEVASTKYPQM
jgi:hypothetical protein